MRIRHLLVGILIFGAVHSARAADNLRVATFNINWGNVNLLDIHRVIVAADADLICIQESTRDSERFLKQRLREEFSHIFFKGHRGKYAAERFGFLSKLPLKDVRYIPPADGLFGTYIATAKHDKLSIKIVNVHLSPFLVRRGSNFRQALQAISAVEAVHQKEIKTVATNVDPNSPTLVCGDFNSMSTFAAPKQLVDMGLVDSFASVTDNADTQPTWQWPVGKFHIQFRIDYIFHTRHFTTLNSRIIPTKGSDHYLLVTEMALKPPD